MLLGARGLIGKVKRDIEETLGLSMRGGDKKKKKSEETCSLCLKGRLWSHCEELTTPLNLALKPSI